MMCYFQNVKDYRKIPLQINVRKYQRGSQNGHARETGNIVYTRRRQTKQKHNAICVGHQYTCTQTNTNNVNKT